MAVDYYELLGVERTASTTEIKSAYRSLAKVMHPDAGGTAGTFRLLQDAYRTLTDPSRRAAYDRRARPGDQPTPSATPATTSPGRVGDHRTRPGSRPRSRSGARPRARSGAREWGEDPHFVPPVPDIPPAMIPWWNQVDPRQGVRYVPPAGPGSLAVAAAATVPAALAVPLLTGAWRWPSLLVLWLVAVGVPLALTVWLVVRGVAVSRTARRFHTEFGAGRVFGRVCPERAHRAESATAELLRRYLVRLPGVRIFHGLAWPGSVFADIDHAVLCGRRLVLLESKLWLPGHYTVDEDGEVWRNGHPFRGGAVGLAGALAAYRELLPDVDVAGAVLLYPSRDGELTVDDLPHEPASQVTVLTPEEFVRDFGSWLAVEPATVDRDVFRRVRDQVVS